MELIDEWNIGRTETWLKKLERRKKRVKEDEKLKN
jgi:hypothetical protein